MPQKSVQRAAKALPRNFYEIRLELARETSHPDGSRELGYRFIAPLNAQNRIDVDLWKQHRDECRVVRFRPHEDDEVGHLVHRGGNSWSFHYDIQGAGSDETGYRFADERFLLGEYVSIQEADGMRTFRVVSVEHV